MNNPEKQTVNPAPLPLLTFRCPHCRTKWLMPGVARQKSHICKICGHHFEIEPEENQAVKWSADLRDEQTIRRY